MQGSAPVYSLADEAQARAESAAWHRFTAPADENEFCLSWLALLCTRIERCRAALLLTGESDAGPFRVSAVWPDRRRDLQYLGPTAQRALAERTGVVLTPANGGAPDAPPQIAYPVEVQGRLWGAVVLELQGSSEAELQRALRNIHWGMAWLVDHFRQRMMGERETVLARVDLVNEAMATALSHRQLRPSALAVANALAQRLKADRVSVGLELDGHVQPLVMSHMATFDPKSDLVRSVGAAMDEVLDLGVPLQHPAPDESALTALAHADLARERKLDAVLSVPLLQEGQTVGAITLERNSGQVFDEQDISVAKAAGQLLGPVWCLQREQEASWWQRTRQAMRAQVQVLFGPRHPGAKLLAATAVLLLAVLTFWKVDHRVSARTVVEGSQQVAAVAPFDGFLAQASVRAGDTVRQGQLMARLDDRDLKLEAARWGAEREQLLRRYQVAQATQDRSAMGVVAAQVAQADAQLKLATERLARTQLVAPFDGVVVSGDWSQQIGSPVEQGRLLFEVAPSAGYRVILQVDERDVARLNVGQTGELVLSGMPGEVMAFTVRRVTPVSTQQDGRNFFRMEAELQPGQAQRLRPGLEGIGKVTVGRERLLWVWTHGLTDWLRLSFWNWMP